MQQRTIGPQIIRTLNEMLEEERAAVQAVIGLASMATDPNERETLQRIGGDEVWSCSGLRERIENLGGTASVHISDFANYVLSLEYYPERLRTYGRHQRLIMERIATLLAQRGLDTDTRVFLEEMQSQHQQDIAWCEMRAQFFEASRYNSGERIVYPSPSVSTPPRPVIRSGADSLQGGTRSPIEVRSSMSEQFMPVRPSPEVPATRSPSNDVPVAPPPRVSAPAEFVQPAPVPEAPSVPQQASEHSSVTPESPSATPEVQEAPASEAPAPKRRVTRRRTVSTPAPESQDNGKE
jgi:bacterioferritin (cytochrome b1)